MTLAVLLGPSSTVGDSCVHVDSPIAFEKEAYHLPYVLTVLRAVLFLLSAGHVYQVVSCIPSELCLSYSDRSIHSRDKSVGCMLDSRVCAYSFLVGSPYWQPHDLGVHKISKFVPHFDNILGRRSNLLICECGRDQRHMFRQVYLSEGWVVCDIKCLTPPQYEAPSMYGPNMVGLEGAEWKRHRVIAKAAFNEANNAFAWQETIRIVHRSRFHPITWKDRLPQTSISVATWHEKLC